MIIHVNKPREIDLMNAINSQCGLSGNNTYFTSLQSELNSNKKLVYVGTIQLNGVIHDLETYVRTYHPSWIAKRINTN